MDWKIRELELEIYYNQLFGENGEVAFSEFLDTVIHSKQKHFLDAILQRDTCFKAGLHGYLHAIKVATFAFYMGCYWQISEEEMKILLLAAKYHDVGREDDSDNLEHGYKSAKWVEKNLADITEKDKKEICFLIEVHSCPDELINTIGKLYGFNMSDKYLLLANILKDADALDRYRLHVRALDPEYLRSEVAAKLRKAAFVFHYYVLLNGLMKHKPSYLYHTSFTNQLKCLKPHENWDMYGESKKEYVFASDKKEMAILYFLHGEKMQLYSFEFQGIIYALISCKEKVIHIFENDKSWLYRIDSSHFYPIISKQGRYDGEWVAEQEVELQKEIVPQKIDWSMIETNGICIFYPVQQQEYLLYRKLFEKMKGNYKKKELLDYLVNRKCFIEFKGE